MPVRIAPLRALRYRAQQVGDLGAVWAPPYDVIGAAEAVELRSRHSHNIVRVTNPQGEDEARYERAAKTLRAWIADGALVREEQPAVFLHQHRFDVDGVGVTRTGIWTLLELVPFAAGVVLPHEQTMGGPKADRLAIMRACRAQLSPIFMICSDPGGRVGGLFAELAAAAASERAEFPAGHEHEIWRVNEPALLAELASRLRDQVLLIADGHHRYETALAYREELIAAGATHAEGPHQFVLAYVVPEGDPGLLLLPTHRVVSGERLDWAAALERIGPRFEVERLDQRGLESVETLLKDATGSATFVLVVEGSGGGWLVKPRGSSGADGFAAIAFHQELLAGALGLTSAEQLERVSYLRDADEALARVRNGDVRAAALLAPPRVDQVREAAARGERLPSKTTYFWPKVPTGIAIHPIDPDERWD